jgi:Zn-dependent metalloprotease
VASAVTPFKTVYPKAQITFSPNTGLPTRITGLEESTADVSGSKDPFEAVAKLLKQTQFKTLFATAFDPKQKKELEQVESHADPVDPTQTIVTYRQRVQGLPVFGSEAKFVVTEGAKGPTVSLGLFSLQRFTNEVDTHTEVSAGVAQKNAVTRYQALLNEDRALKGSEIALFHEFPPPSEPKLTMFDPSVLGETKISGLRPTWIVKIGGMVFFIDAKSGTVLHEYRNVHSLTSFEIVDYDSLMAPGKPVLSESGSPAAGSPAEAQSALNNAISARVFFGSLHRDVLGICDCCDPDIKEPHPLNVNIRYSGTPNGMWVSELSSAYFATGYAEAPDVVTHELMHGVTQYASCLTPDGPSGAVNEALSDFFAAVLRQNSHLNPWVIGDSLSEFRPPKEPLRSFANPHLNGFNPILVFNLDTNRGQPEKYSEVVTIDHLICSSNDIRNHCAHLNSGILNKAAYLAVQGGTFNGQSINGIGMPKMTAIVNAAVSLLGRTSDPPTAAALIIERCNALATKSTAGIAAQDCANVTKAYRAVELL